MENKYQPWLDWAIEIQAIAQNGLTYAKDVYDLERYERLRELSAEMISSKTEISKEKVRELFCSDKGYQTPKIDTRGVVFRNGKILLVREKNGLWTLPGGWMDMLETVKTNTVKEVREEAGMDVKAVKIIAIQNREKHNRPPHAYRIVKIFVLCELLGGAFQENSETTEADWFTLDDLPQLSDDKSTYEQVKMCFEAAACEVWEPLFD